jgi:biotin carboxyl carrier protein
MRLDATLDGRSVRVEVRERDGRYHVTLGEKTLEVDYVETGRDFVSLLLNGVSHEVGLSRIGKGYAVVLRGDAFEVTFEDAIRANLGPAKASPGTSRVLAPMPGKIVRILTEIGQHVVQGQALLVMEAMKMENELRAPQGGEVRELPVREGQTVETGALLALLE